MIATFLRLFALRPILASSLLGIPILTLIVLGLFTALLLKFLLFVVIPVGLVVWIVRAMFRKSERPWNPPAPPPPPAEPVQSL